MCGRKSRRKLFKALLELFVLTNFGSLQPKLLPRDTPKPNRKRMLGFLIRKHERFHYRTVQFWKLAQIFNWTWKSVSRNLKIHSIIGIDSRFSSSTCLGKRFDKCFDQPDHHWNLLPMPLNEILIEPTAQCQLYLRAVNSPLNSLLIPHSRNNYYSKHQLWAAN